MKTIHKLFLLAVCMLAMSAFGQQNPPAQGSGDDQGQGHHRRGMPSVDDQVKHLTEQLSLTDDQQTKVKAIVQDTHDQAAKLMQDESMSREDKMTKMRSLHETASGKVREILTDEQKKKFDDMQKEMQEHMRDRHQGGDNSNPK